MLLRSKVLRALAVSVTLSGAFVAVQVAPAQASGLCEGQVSTTYERTESWCYGKGSGTYFKGAARCQNFSAGVIRDRYGPRMGANNPQGSANKSYAYCLSNEEYLGNGNRGLGYVWPA